MATIVQPSLSSLRDCIAAELPELIQIRHDLHAHPELGYEEHRTSEVVQRELTRAGVAFKAGLAGERVCWVICPRREQPEA
jgi:hippurate hydrolase